MKTTFDKAIDRLTRINTYLDKRDWDIRDSHPMRDTQVKIFQIQRDRLDEEISKLKRYAAECQQTVDDEVYTSPFGPNGQEHIPATKRDRDKAQSELKKIKDAIGDLRGMWLKLMDDERELFKQGG